LQKLGSNIYFDVLKTLYLNNSRVRLQPTKVNLVTENPGHIWEIGIIFHRAIRSCTGKVAKTWRKWCYRQVSKISH